MPSSIFILIYYLNWDALSTLKELNLHTFWSTWLANRLINLKIILVVVQLLSCVQLFSTPWTVAYQAPLFFTISQNLLKFTFIESVMLSNHLILCHRFLLLPSVFPNVRVFSNESALSIGWPKCCCIGFSISLPVNIQCWFPFGLAVLISLQSKGPSRVFSSTIWDHQFFSAQPSLWSNSHIHIWLLEKL